MTIEENDHNANDAKARLAISKERLWKEARESFFRLVERAPASWKSPDARLYRTEQRILMSHIEPFYWGTFAGVFLFATLRVSGSQWFSKVRQRYYSSLNPQKVKSVEPLVPTQLPPKRPVWKTHLEKQTEKQEAYAKDVLKLPSDALIGILSGLSSILWLSRPSQFCKDVVEAPLLPGKSVVYEFVCPEMESTFERFVTADVLDQGETDDTLRSFAALVYNCRQRSKYLQNKEGETTQPGFVPYPGLEGERLP